MMILFTITPWNSLSNPHLSGLYYFNGLSGRQIRLRFNRFINSFAGLWFFSLFLLLGTTLLHSDPILLSPAYFHPLSYTNTIDSSPMRLIEGKNGIQAFYHHGTLEINHTAINQQNLYPICGEIHSIHWDDQQQLVAIGDTWGNAFIYSTAEQSTLRASFHHFNSKIIDLKLHKTEHSPTLLTLYYENGIIETVNPEGGSLSIFSIANPPVQILSVSKSGDYLFYTTTQTKEKPAAEAILTNHKLGLYHIPTQQSIGQFDFSIMDPDLCGFNDTGDKAYYFDYNRSVNIISLQDRQILSEQIIEVPRYTRFIRLINNQMILVDYTLEQRYRIGYYDLESARLIKQSQPLFFKPKNIVMDNNNTLYYSTQIGDILVFPESEEAYRLSLPKLPYTPFIKAVFPAQMPFEIHSSTNNTALGEQTNLSLLLLLSDHSLIHFSPQEQQILDEISISGHPTPVQALTIQEEGESIWTLGSQKINQWSLSNGQHQYEYYLHPYTRVPLEIEKLPFPDYELYSDYNSQRIPELLSQVSLYYKTEDLTLLWQETMVPDFLPEAIMQNQQLLQSTANIPLHSWSFSLDQQHFVINRGQSLLLYTQAIAYPQVINIPGVSYRSYYINDTLIALLTNQGIQKYVMSDSDHMPILINHHKPFAVLPIPNQNFIAYHYDQSFYVLDIENQAIIFEQPLSENFSGLIDIDPSQNSVILVYEDSVHVYSLHHQTYNVYPDSLLTDDRQYLILKNELGAANQLLNTSTLTLLDLPMDLTDEPFLKVYSWNASIVFVFPNHLSIFDLYNQRIVQDQPINGHNVQNIYLEQNQQHLYITSDNQSFILELE